VWYLFSKFTGAFDELETEYLRTTYPEFSIGKLAAAQVDSLQITDGNGKNVYCAFYLIGLSSNMKLRAGQRVYLIPNQIRDMPLSRIVEAYKVTIAEMVWDSKIKGYIVTTEETSSNFWCSACFSVEYPFSPKIVLATFLGIFCSRCISFFSKISIKFS
jgi:hypothetical protein